MATKQHYNGLDYFKIVAAILVIAIHTGPLTTYSEYADFLLTSIIGRIAVPFFFMASGFFLFRKLIGETEQNREVLRRFTFKIAVIYVASILLYLPLNVYAGHYKEAVSVYGIFKMIIFDGTFYHLWYLPALIIGAHLVYYLSRKLSLAFLMVVTGSLYIIGLFGDSYYGLAEQIPVVNTAYSTMFMLFDYTRNGLLFAPLFLALGLFASRQPKETRLPKVIATYFVIALSLLLFEGMMVRAYSLSRHDSMYVFLVPAVYYLFQWLLVRQGNDKPYARPYVRHLSLWIYILHPLAIVLIRAIGKLTGFSSILITNSLIHFIVVTLFSCILAMIVVRVSQFRENKQPQHRAWREINLAHLAHNLTELKSALPSDCNIMAIVKADAYGHGSIEVARLLNKAGVRFFAVAEISEGITLRNGGVKGDILVLGETCESRFGELVRYKLQQTIISTEYGQCLNDYGRKINVHIKIDTGMSRLGERYDNMERIRSMYHYKNLQVIGTYSHLSVSDSLEITDIDYTRSQMNRFHNVIEELKSEGVDPGVLHMQSSYGILNYPAAGYGMARPGIALFGVLSNGNEVKTPLRLRPVLSLRAKIVLVKNIQGNRPIGYGCDCLTIQDSTIATISIGYADGIPRVLSENGGCVLIRGQIAKIMGKICMDHMMVDVTHIADVQRGDIATLIGQDGDAMITAEQVAEQCGTITNEILSRIGSRVERVYS